MQQVQAHTVSVIEVSANQQKGNHQAAIVGKKHQTRSSPFKAERITSLGRSQTQANCASEEEEDDIRTQPLASNPCGITSQPSNSELLISCKDFSTDKTAFNKQSRSSVGKKKKNKKKSLSSSSVRCSAEQAGSEEESNLQDCSPESSDDSNNSSEGYASSGSGLNDRSKHHHNWHHTSSYHTMTNGNINHKLMPFDDSEGQLLVTTANEDGSNGWSDLNLSTMPPQSKDSVAAILPNVAQLSVDLSPSQPSKDALVVAPSTNKSVTKRDLKNGENVLIGGKIRSSSESSSSSSEFGTDYSKPVSFLLLDEQEVLQVKTSEEFCRKLGCEANTLVKVVSIFGNTGEGKSHTLNYTFYQCQEIFHTSYTQSSCTIGIWCAYDRKRKVITIDTEGLLGLSDNNNRRTRLLLKVLAISDIIIYRTRAERLHNDLFTFLGSASQAYVKHFAKELRAASERCNLSCTLSDLVCYN